jgi:Reverse transcriptase (RNA-dependent DNA polymerase)/RNase H-like domain found in reverse transcriptase
VERSLDVDNEQQYRKAEAMDKVHDQQVPMMPVSVQCIQLDESTVGPSVDELKATISKVYMTMKGREDGEAAQANASSVDDGAVYDQTMHEVASCLTRLSHEEPVVDADAHVGAGAMLTLKNDRTPVNDIWSSSGSPSVHTPGQSQSSDSTNSDEDAVAVDVTTNSEPELRPRKNVYVKAKLKDDGDVTTLNLLVDSGAEISMISTSLVRKFKGKHLRRVRNGDVSAIRLAAGAELVLVKAIATLWVNFGLQLFRHSFVVADINTSAILGSDFQGTHGSTICYRTMQFHPSGDKCRSVPLQEAVDCNTVTIQQDEYQVETQRAVDNNTEVKARVRNFVLAEETVIPPHTRLVIEGVVLPAYTGSEEMYVVIEDDDAHARETSCFRVAATLTSITAGEPVFTEVCNMASTPIVIPEGAVLAHITPLLHAVVSSAISSVEEATAAYQQFSSTVTTSKVNAVNVPRSTGLQERRVPRELVDDEEIEQLLLCEGQVAPALQGADEDGLSKIDKARAMLRRNRMAFCKDPKHPPVTHLMDFEIDTGDARPSSEKARRFGDKETEFIDQYVQDSKRRGHIIESTSPWATNPVLVKQGGKIRFCVDYRKLNAVTKKDAHGLGNIDDLLRKFHGATVFSSMDLASGYYQVPLTEDASAKTAFRTPHGDLWQYTVAPFGLVNLPATFTRLMHSVLGGALGVFALVYIDDIIVYSQSFSDHLLHLEEVFQRLIRANLSCSLPKSQLFREMVQFVGHIVGKDGVSPCPSKVQAMRDMSEPIVKGKLDMKSVNAVLGLFNYYRRYVPNYSTIAAPLVRLTRKETDFEWTEECKRSFETLKKELSEGRVLAHPDSSLPYVMYTDASGTAISAVLSQFHPLAPDVDKKSAGRVVKATAANHPMFPEGTLLQEVVISYYSKLNSVQDAKMAPVELECQAVVMGLLYFRPYVWGHHITVVTDAAALRWLLTLQDGNGKLMRWALRIQEFDITVQHRPGLVNNNADGLSRLPQQSQLDKGRDQDAVEVDWPDALQLGDAPTSGVKFEDVPVVSTCRGCVVSTKYGTPFKFSDLVKVHQSERDKSVYKVGSANVKRQITKLYEPADEDDQFSKEMTDHLITKGGDRDSSSDSMHNFKISRTNSVTVKSTGYYTGPWYEIDTTNEEELNLEVLPEARSSFTTFAKPQGNAETMNLMAVTRGQLKKTAPDVSERVSKDTTSKKRKRFDDGGSKLKKKKAQCETSVQLEDTQ